MVLGQLNQRLRKFLGLGKPGRSHRNLKARFSHVYRTRAWASEQSASGPGSDRNSGSVRQACIALNRVVRDHGIRSIADAPCGDFNWMPDFLSDHPGIDYVGYDIVDEMIAANRAKHPRHRFVALDITRRAPERADLIFSKDMVNHLLERDVWRALANMVRSGSTYLLITSNSDPNPNMDLAENFGGMSRTLNLRTAPYSFPPPLYDDGYLALWRIADLNFVLERGLI